MNSLISFNNVNLNFGGVNALTEVSFDIKENSLFAIIGPYGSIEGLLFSKKARKEEEKARKIAEDIIDFLEIEEYRYSYILSLPYGIQKRIELARALAMKPKILLLDEPAAGMNNEETEDIARFILDIHEELGVTVVLIDHDMNMVMDIATEVIVMDFGKKLFDGNPTEASKNKNVIEAYLGVSE